MVPNPWWEQDDAGVESDDDDDNDAIEVVGQYPRGDGDDDEQDDADDAAHDGDDDGWTSDRWSYWGVVGWLVKRAVKLARPQLQECHRKYRAGEIWFRNTVAECCSKM